MTAMVLIIHTDFIMMTNLIIKESPEAIKASGLFYGSHSTALPSFNDA